MSASSASNSAAAATPANVMHFRGTDRPFATPPPHGLVPNSDSDRARTSAFRAAPREFTFLLSAFLMVTDWLVAAGAIFAGLQVREWQRSGVVFNAERGLVWDSFLMTWGVVGGAVFLWLMVFFRTYDSTNLYRVRRWFKNAVKAVIAWSVLIWAYLGVFHVTEYSPRVGVAYCAATLLVSFVLWRMAAFMFLIRPRVREAASSRVIVVGWNKRATHLRSAMRRDLGQLQEIIGCVPMPGGQFTNPPPPDVAVLGDYSALPELVTECRANAIILSDVSCPAQEIQHLITFCQREMLGFQLVPAYFPALNSGLQIETTSGVPLLGVRQLPLDRTLNRTIKRIMDIVGSIIGLAVCAIVIPPFALLLYLESPGPIFYRQIRTSRGGRTFTIYKIRSMRLDAESKSGAVWAQKDDPRRLKIGAFMRKTNIDELPQFWNVLIGDMSLVGPRPERPELIEKFKDTIPNYNARHEVRTAITGWAQINGLRGDTDLTKRIEADLYYLENWSPALDLYCIVATMFKIKNAY